MVRATHARPPSGLLHRVDTIDLTLLRRSLAERYTRRPRFGQWTALCRLRRGRSIFSFFHEPPLHVPRFESDPGLSMIALSAPPPPLVSRLSFICRIVRITRATIRRWGKPVTANSREIKRNLCSLYFGARIVSWRTQKACRPNESNEGESCYTMWLLLVSMNRRVVVFSNKKKKKKTRRCARRFYSVLRVFLSRRQFRWDRIWDSESLGLLGLLYSVVLYSRLIRALCYSKLLFEI